VRSSDLNFVFDAPADNIECNLGFSSDFNLSIFIFDFSNNNLSLSLETV
jgi:hypothetical protein